ncbi:MAG: SpoVG family protein [Eubacteriales bacterium]
MNITDVRIKKIQGDTSTKAVVSVTIDDALVVHDIRVVEGKNGLFVAMPAKKVGDKYVDISHPITSQSRTLLFDTVLSQYRQLS